MATVYDVINQPPTGTWTASPGSDDSRDEAAPAVAADYRWVLSIVGQWYSHICCDCITGREVTFLESPACCTSGPICASLSVDKKAIYILAEWLTTCIALSADKKATHTERLIDQQVASWQAVWYTNGIRLPYSMKPIYTGHGYVTAEYVSMQ